MENPFKFGTIVENEYFTDRVEEVGYISQFVNSPNHLVLISPRRFGKSSVVAKAIAQTGRKSMTVNLQQATSVADFAAKLLREFFKVHPMERVRHLITHFRFIPTISTNAITGTMDVSFQPGIDSTILLEDVMQLIEQAHSSEERLIVVLDEFQEILDLAPHLDKRLRAIMQNQKHINYILLGSQESMMTDIFEKKKSPFYHFGELMRLSKLPRDDFHRYLSETKHESVISKQILRSGTSIGANINEAQYGNSKADFIAKLHIALKETAETEYWLHILQKSEYLDDSMAASMLNDCLEIKRILITSINTAKNNNN